MIKGKYGGYLAVGGRWNMDWLRSRQHPGLQLAGIEDGLRLQEDAGLGACTASLCCLALHVGVLHIQNAAGHSS